MTKSINQLLREALGERAAVTTPTRCLDAEAAAAFADDTLSANERSVADAHLADCARCQALLAALARTMPPALAPAWWRRPVMAWLAPLTVAAAAAIVWVSVPRHTTIAPAAQSARAGAPSLETDSSRPSPPAVATEMRSLSARDSAAAPLAAPGPVSTRDRDRTPPAKSVPETIRRSALADNRSIAPSVAQGAPAAGRARAADAQLPSTSLPQAPPPAAAPLAAADSSRAAPAEQAPQRSLAERATVTSEAAGRALARRLDAAQETVIVSSNPMNRWRLGTGGVVQHSGDGGSTWLTQSTGVSVTLTAGSSPSPSVCWLVGPAGVVLVSTDEGRSWQRLAFPVAIDLISVRATDDKTATVVTADRRTFSTSDSGRNWGR
jgi:hypothetical protein